MGKVLSLDTARTRRASPAHPAKGPEANPAELWIQSRKPGKSQVQAAHALDTVARLLGYAAPDSQRGAWRQCPWWRLGYKDVKVLRAKLRQEIEDGHYVVGHASHILTAAISVMREVWRLSDEDHEYLSDKQWLLIADIDKLPGDQLRKPRRTVTDDEYARIIAHCKQDDSPRGLRDLALYGVAAYAGLRASEFAALVIDDYDREGKRLRVPQIKTKVSEEDVWNPLEEPVLGYLDRWLVVRGMGKGALFSRLERGGMGLVQPLAPESVSEVMKWRARELDIEGVTCHAMRRYFVTRMLRLTGDLALTQKLVRHATSSTTSRYYDQRGDGDKREAIKKLSAKEDAPGD